ncbi:MAG: hypothetical protein QXU35_05385 [Zestosphaera sp.]
MWLLLSTMYVAFLGLTDLLVDLVAINYYGIDAVTLGLLSGLWVILYALTSKIASRTAESRGPKTLIMISMLTVQTFIYFLLVLKGIQYLFIAQALHAVSVALAKNAVSIAILDNMDEREWDSVNRRYFQVTLFFEGFLLYITSWFSLSLVVDSALWFSIVSGVICSLLFYYIPSGRFSLTRSLYRTERSINTSLTAVGILASLGYEPLYIPSKARAFSRVWSSKVALTTADVMFSTSAFKVSNSFLFTPLSFIFIRLLNLSNEVVLTIYGVAKLSAALALTLLPTSFGRNLTLAALILRLLAASLIISAFLTKNYEITLTLALVYLANVIVDSKLYSLYIDASLASSPATYTILSEISSFAGALTSGYVLTLGGMSLLLTTMTALTLVAARAPFKSGN